MPLPRSKLDPCRVDALGADRPLHDARGSRALESAHAAAHPPQTAMRLAGRAVARCAIAIAPHARHVWLACGPGNNGGDGFFAAADLAAAGRRVRVSFASDESRLPEDARVALAAARRAGVDIAAEPPDHADLAIDALLGMGLSRPPAGAIAGAILRLNACGAPVLAVDLPSGLDADTGARVGELAVRADATLSLLTLKPGLFTAAGRAQAGEIWFDALGADLGHEATFAWLIGGDRVLALPARDDPTAHKGRFGDVLVVAGAARMRGALRLAARSALGAGAGRVYASPLDDDDRSEDGARPELMWRPEAWRSEPPWLRDRVVVCGCGGGDAVRAALPPLVHHAGRLVLDADALNAVAADRALQASLAARRARGLMTVVTPHPLEAARLAGIEVDALQRGRFAAAQMLADRLQAVVVLKGSGTLVAAPGCLPLVNPTGNARLATAGTGDVLAGWIGGLWAQAGRADDGRDVAAAAVWAHGKAAEWAPAAPWPLRAADLIDAMRSVRERLAGTAGR